MSVLPTPGRTPLHRAGGQTFGGSFMLASTDADDLPRAAAVLSEFESTLSRFRPGSALSRLNRDGRLPAPPALLVTALRAALDAAVRTEGLVDATILPSLEAAGYDRSFVDVPDRAGGATCPHEPAIDRIRISERALVLPRGCRVDLGGVAKGLAVDHALAAMRGERALVNAAGDVRVRGGGFTVDLKVLPDAPHPLDTRVRLDAGALATSGVTRRHWVGPDGARRHHLIDPRTGAPAEGPWLLATVWAPTCLDADVRAKEAFLLGQRAPARLAELGLAGRLVDRQGKPVGAGSLGMTVSHVLWYTSRGTALSALVALSLALGLGQLLASGVRSRRWPRVASNEAHRLLSLSATGLIVLHVATVLADGYLPFRPLDAVVPFQAPYRSLTVGLGTLAFDSVLVVLVLVAFRRRLGYARWRRTHHLAYVVWLLAVVHGLGSGTDTSAWWMRGTTALCVAAVAGGVACRIGAARRLSIPAAAAGATAALLLGAALAQPAARGQDTRHGLLTPISLSWRADQGRTLEEVSMLGVGPVGRGVRFRLDLVLGLGGQARLRHGLVQLSYPPGHRCRGTIELLRTDLLVARCGRRPLRIAFSSFGPGAAQGFLRLG